MADPTCCDPTAAGCCDASPAPFEARPGDDARLAELCRALGHPHRVYIVRFLAAQRSCFAGAIADELPVAASTVSQHLKQLKQAGVIQGEVDGARRCYCLSPDALGDLRRLLGAL